MRTVGEFFTRAAPNAILHRGNPRRSAPEVRKLESSKEKKKGKKERKRRKKEKRNKQIASPFSLSTRAARALARSRFNEAKSLMRGARGLTGRKGPEVTACNNYGALSAT